MFYPVYVNKVQSPTSNNEVSAVSDNSEHFAHQNSRCDQTKQSPHVNLHGCINRSVCKINRFQSAHYDLTRPSLFH